MQFGQFKRRELITLLGGSGAALAMIWPQVELGIGGWRGNSGSPAGQRSSFVGRTATIKNCR
jgi:hypothetical protein